MTGFWVFDPDVVTAGIFKPFAACLPMGSPSDVRGEVVEGAADYKGELFRVEFKGD